MLLLAQINIGINSVAIAGFLYIILGIIQLYLAIVRNSFQNRFMLAYLAEIIFLAIIYLNFAQLSSNGLIFWLPSLLVVLPAICLFFTNLWSNHARINIFSQLFESFFFPNLLVWSGLIFLVQGWRLDPILQTQAFWILIVVMYLFFQPKQT